MSAGISLRLALARRDAQAVLPDLLDVLNRVVRRDQVPVGLTEKLHAPDTNLAPRQDRQAPDLRDPKLVPILVGQRDPHHTVAARVGVMRE
jgi:hypothetical protein